MITLLFVLAIGQSFDVTPYNAAVDVQTMELQTVSLKTVATEIAVSDVRLEPVHDSTTWPSPLCAQVELCLPLSEDTQVEPYFK